MKFIDPNLGKNQDWNWGIPRSLVDRQSPGLSQKKEDFPVIQNKFRRDSLCSTYQNPNSNETPGSIWVLNFHYSYFAVSINILFLNCP